MAPRHIVESLTDEELAALSNSLPLEFERRGLLIHSAVGVLADSKEAKLTNPLAVKFNLNQHYQRATAALVDINTSLCEGKDIPSLAAVEHGLGEVAREWLAERARAGIKDELVIAPSLGDIKLDQFIKRFDRKQAINTYRWKELWQAYQPEAHNNGSKGWQVAVVLNDHRHPRDESEAINRYGEPGLAYTGLTLADQQKALRREAKHLAKLGLQLQGITITQLITLNAKRRLNGETMLDERTFTRLNHYPPVALSQFGWVPATNWLRGRLRLFGSEANLGWDRFGIRRVLKIDLTNARK